VGALPRWHHAMACAHQDCERSGNVTREALKTKERMATRVPTRKARPRGKTGRTACRGRLAYDAQISRHTGVGTFACVVKVGRLATSRWSKCKGWSCMLGHSTCSKGSHVCALVMKACAFSSSSPREAGVTVDR
jgi:hypothetical protein